MGRSLKNERVRPETIDRSKGVFTHSFDPDPAKPNKEIQQMKRLIASVLFACVSVGPALADSPKAQSKDPAVIDAVKQVEQDMGKAMVAGDIDKLNQIYADDFATIGSSGKITTKQNLLSDFASFHDKLEWFENGPMDVQVFGNVAVAQGSVKEKRSLNGKDTSGEFVWMDLLEKRAGKWVVLRSASARVVLADSPKAQSQDPILVETIKQFEQEVGDAMVARNIEKLNQVYADDWATIGSSGKIFTKESLLSDFKSGKHKLVSFENGPMDVQVLGNVAVVQASVNEKRIQDGKDISGDFVYMDLLEKRAGKWVVVRTLGARVS
jgi:ketosteroid isomerase-like protein